MGLTCASLHLLAPDLAAAEPASRQSVLRAALAQALGCEPVDNADEAERHLIVAAAPPWISFFDAAEVLAKELPSLGVFFSGYYPSPALYTAVFDSDTFGFLLYEKGKQVDGHASARGLLPGRIKKWPPDKRVQEWSRLFGRPILAEDVQPLTEKGVLFADFLLHRLCTLLGIPVNLAASMPRDLETRPWSTQQQFFFRSRPGAAGTSPVKQTAGHLPKTLRRQLTVGGEDSLCFELRGPASAFADPVLEFTGPAVDAGLVELSGHDQRNYALWAFDLKAILAGNIHRIHATSSEETAAGRRTLRTQMKGLSAAAFGFPPRKQTILILWAALRGVAAGSGEVHVTLAPHGEAADRLALRPVFEVEVTA